jgi:hypothetical protein
VKPSVWYTAEQPTLFPALYLMERMARVHHWVVLEEAQFDRDHVQFKVMAQHGVLTLSVELEGASRRPFNECGLRNPQRWAEKTAFTLQTCYGKQSPYRALKPQIEALFDSLSVEPDLVRACDTTLLWCADLLGIDATVWHSKQLVAERPEEPTAWMASFADPLEATDYLQGADSMRSYFVKGPFEDRGMLTWGQDFRYRYTSVQGRGVEASMSVLDALFVQGVEATRSLLHLDRGRGFIGTAVQLSR